MADRAVVLLSGGLDSAVALAVARRRGLECHCLSFDYGQRHRHELAAAEQVARSLGAAHWRLITLGLAEVGGSALTTSRIAVPKDRDESQMAGHIPVTYVPARNLVFLSIAVGMAEVLQAGEIFIGVNAVDYSGYPDCRPQFIRAFQDAARLGTKAGVEGRGVTIETPLLDLTKAQIIRLGADLGVDFSLTHSCYDPTSVGGGGGVVACGRCDSCLIRRRGFREAGVADPTPYAE